MRRGAGNAGHIARAAVVALCGALWLCATACAPERGAAARVSAKNARAGVQEIDYLTFSLPREIDWRPNPERELGDAGIAEWIMAGFAPADSPVRVMYRKITPPEAPPAAWSRVLEPLDRCADSRTNVIRNASKYHDQLNFEAVCARMADRNYGLVSYVSIMNDREATHMVVAALRTPVMDRAGVYRAEDDESRKRAERMRALSILMRGVIQSVRACDSRNFCI